METEMTLYTIFTDAVKRYGSDTALRFLGEPGVSFSDTQVKAHRIQDYLLRQGLKAGDKIALLSENSPAWSIIYFAITTGGLTVVPILPDFKAPDITKILVHSETELLIASPKQQKKMAEESLPCSIVSPEELTELPPAEASHPLLKPAPPAPDDLAAIIYTSGTTGDPKGVMLTHGNIASNVKAATPIPQMKEKEDVLSLLPLSHAYECTIGFIIPFSLGARITYLRKPPSPTVLLPALKAVRPGVMLTVPLFIEKIYRQKIAPQFQKNRFIRGIYRLPPLRKLLNRAAGKKLMALFGGRLYFFGIGGAPLAPDTEKFLREARFPYAIGYGLTETSPLIAGDNFRSSRFRSTGRVLPGVAVRIANPDPKTAEGEIQVKGPNVMKGYYKNSDLTSEALTDDGWFKTGDLGILANKNYLYIKGRLKNMILGPNGENIYPESIENFINSCAYVEDSVVFSHQGKLVARVHLNYEELKAYWDQFFRKQYGTFRDFLQVHLNTIQKTVNKQVSHFAKVTFILEQKEPFIKTPTRKIKRYLYTVVKGPMNGPLQSS